MTAVYLPEIGFRPAGVRLVEPVHASVGSRTLALTDLIATPQGTDLAYYLTGLRGDEGDEPRKEIVAVRRGNDQHVVTQGTFPLKGADQRVVTRRINSTKVIPRLTGPVDISIGITGVGEFHLDARLMTFGPETATPRRNLNASVMHDGTAVTVGGFAAGREEIAIEIEAVAPDGQCCAGIGAYGGHRVGPTALSLRDESGRVYIERWQEPDGRYDHKTLAIFQPADPDARELELSVPYVYVEEQVITSAVDLPVTTPVEMRLGRYGIRVLATERVPGNPTARSPRFREAALGVDVDLGGWHGDRRMLWPGPALIDADFCNLGFRTQPGMDMRQPEPANRIEIFGDRALTGRTLAFRRPLIQVRGPWEFRIPLV
ncbi:MAG TPA: hypothetical protein VEP48_09225 [Methylomirabilota bacterium]|nr:hypothetical protein [Methylomirabilota bacterium]